MAYSELIKSFEKIRSYIREFYVYGFRYRDEIGEKSSRSYDNERRRVESWLGEYMMAGQDSKGKRTYLSVDSRSIPHNPLYKPFKAKSFTDGDIFLHFLLMDVLTDCGSEGICLHDLLASFTDMSIYLDESTVRKKLSEYIKIGLVSNRKIGKTNYYYLPEDNVDLESFETSLLFFSEVSPLGVVGSFLLDKLDEPIDIFSFKHHHLLYALDSEIVSGLIDGIREKRGVEILFEKEAERVIPCKIYISTQTGRHFLFAFCNAENRFKRYRVDRIHKVNPGNVVDEYDKYLSMFLEYAKKMWGVAYSTGDGLEHVEMIVRVEEREAYIKDRLNREKRCGEVKQISENKLLFTADVYSAQEMLPWVRTFIGRIESFKCSNRSVEDRFWKDMDELYGMYDVKTKE